MHTFITRKKWSHRLCYNGVSLYHATTSCGVNFKHVLIIAVLRSALHRIQCLKVKFLLFKFLSESLMKLFRLEEIFLQSKLAILLSVMYFLVGPLTRILLG